MLNILRSFNPFSSFSSSSLILDKVIASDCGADVIIIKYLSYRLTIRWTLSWHSVLPAGLYKSRTSAQKL